MVGGLWAMEQCIRLGFFIDIRAINIHFREDIEEREIERSHLVHVLLFFFFHEWACKHPIWQPKIWSAILCTQ